MPEKYIRYREQIQELRNRGLGLPEPSLVDQIIQWLDSHDGQMPLSCISKGGRNIKRSEMTEEQKEGVALYQRWGKSKEKKALEACRRNPNR